MAFRRFLLICIILLPMLKLFGQDFYDASTVNTIQLYFTQSNWDQLLDNLFSAGDEGRLLGTAIVNGVTYDSVGVRYKGNSSYNASRLKNPFNIKLDYIKKDQMIDGKYGTIKLANGFSDPTLVRETLSYEIARKYMPASKANYANLYVNDQLIGVYTNVQDVDGYFMEDQMHTTDKFRFKCDTNTMSTVTVWGYLGADSTSYATYYGLESDYGWSNLINFTNTLANNQNNIANVMNVDQDLWMCAFDNLLVNLDSPINIFHNFYLFGDADNRVNPILWDLNMSFGGFGAGGGTQPQNLDPLRNATSSSFTLLSHVLSNARYKKMYIAHMRTILNENFTNNWYMTRAAELQAVCGPSVQADPHYFYTYANFTANLTTSVSGGSGGPGGGTIVGISSLMSARATYLNSSTAFSGTVPTIASITHSPEILYQNTTVDFTLTATNATYAQLGIRQDLARKFTYYQMFDDGAHNDGAAGDGVFGVSVPIGYGDVQYYGWAENSSQGAFLPARAEHEFFSAPVNVQPGALVINEIMPRNTLLMDSHDDYDDWVELYNTSDAPIDIAGLYLTDSHFSSGIASWTQIPTGSSDLTTIPAHGYLLVWYDEETDEGPLHINDKLSGSADAVYLIDSNGTTVLDTYTWTDATGLNVDGISIGRNPDGGTTWSLFGTGQSNPATPGSSNLGSTVNIPPIVTNIQYNPHLTSETTPITVSAHVTDANNNVSSVVIQWGIGDFTLHATAMTASGNDYSGQIGPFPLNTTILYRVKATDAGNAETSSMVYQFTVGYVPPAIKINEIMASNTMTITDNHGEYEDWVEIYNPTNTPVNLAGYFVTDDHYYNDDPAYTQIPATQPDSTTIPAHGFKILWFDESPEQGVLHIDAKLAATADGIYLVAPDRMSIVDSVSWVAETGLIADGSYGRLPDGGSIWMLFGNTTGRPVTPGDYNDTTDNDDPVAAGVPELAIYPNPFHDNLTIHVKNTNSPSQVKVYNIKGQMVREWNIETGKKAVFSMQDASMKSLTSGIYFVSVTSGTHHFTRKICLLK